MISTLRIYWKQMDFSKVVLSTKTEQEEGLELLGRMIQNTKNTFLNTIPQRARNDGRAWGPGAG